METRDELRYRIAPLEMTPSEFRKLVAKAHRKIANQRRDFHHKQAKKLVQEHQTIVFEELEITNVSRRAKPRQDEDGH